MTDLGAPTDDHANWQQSRRALSLGLICSVVAYATVFPGTALAQANSRAIAPAEWNKILEAARKEGKIILYATMGQAVHDRIVAAFNSTYPGIKMELVRVVGAAMPPKFEAERLAPNVEGGDAMITADVRWAVNLQKQGGLKTPVGPSAAAWPESYMKNGQIVYLGLNPWNMNYNTNLVKTPITNYRDMLRPELAGKIGSSALNSENTSIWYKWLDETYPGFLEQLAKQNVKLYPSVTAATASTASGEISANMHSVLAVDNAMHAQKGPIRTVIPVPALAFSYGGAIVSWAKNPNAALVAMDFLMSTRGQTVIVGKEEAASPLPNIPGSLDPKNLQLLDWEKSTPESLKAFEGRWNKLFGTR